MRDFAPRLPLRLASEGLDAGSYWTMIVADELTALHTARPIAVVRWIAERLKVLSKQ
jgi:hypothetical protein